MRHDMEGPPASGARQEAEIYSGAALPPGLDGRVFRASSARPVVRAMTAHDLNESCGNSSRVHTAERHLEKLFIPTVHFADAALLRTFLYVALHPVEISWLGSVSGDPDCEPLVVSEVSLRPQHGSGGFTEFDEDKLAEYCDMLGQTMEGLEKLASLHLWGHSHGSLGVFASSTDNEQMKTFRKLGTDWMLRGIYNKAGDAKLWIYRFDLGVVMENVSWTCDGLSGSSLRLDAEFVKAAKQEISENVVICGG